MTLTASPRPSPRTEAGYLRCEPGGKGLVPQHDQRYYTTCIAIVTLQGSASFAVHAAPQSARTSSTSEPPSLGASSRCAAGHRRASPTPRPYHRVDARPTDHS